MTTLKAIKCWRIPGECGDTLSEFRRRWRFFPGVVVLVGTEPDWGGASVIKGKGSSPQPTNSK